MKTHSLIIAIVALILGSLPAFAQQGKGGNRGGSVPQGGVLRSGPLPELNAFTPDGKPLKLRELCLGSYTVLASGCLTCPEFRRNYPEIESASADYSSKGVRFFYFYKSLRHPELDGYVQAQNMKERLLQLAEASKLYGTKVPWMADTIDDSLRIGLRSGSQSVWLISPKGEIVTAWDKIDGAGLREALAQAVGPVANPTPISALGLPPTPRQSRNVNVESATRVERPEGMVILSIVATKPEDTYYVKLRAEATPELLSTGKGRLFLGFYPDPILDAHWNNLTAPMKYTLQLPSGVTATPPSASAAKGQGDSDTEPRQFWVDIAANQTPGDIKLTLNYYGCTPEMCQALTHEYTIRFVPEDRGANTYGFNRSPGGGNGGKKGQPQ